VLLGGDYPGLGATAVIDNSGPFSATAAQLVGVLDLPPRLVGSIEAPVQ